MAMTYQSVTVVGHLGSDPEVRTFQNGGKVANLSVATSRRWKDKSTGEKREKTEWHRISIRNDALVGLVAECTRKGSLLMVIGELETRKWQDQGGVDRYTTEIIVGGYSGTVRLLDSRGEGGGGERGGRPSSGGVSHGSSYSGGGGSYPGDIDDEIPF